MKGGFERLQTGRSIGWRTILGLLLVPLTAAGVLLWGLWNPTERLETVTAAVVNLDEPVTVDGQLVPMGRVLAAELIGSPKPDEVGDTVNFTWVLTDESDAASGLDDGRYATVVTIPENFSAAATSLSGEPEAAQRATINIATSERGRLLDAALSGIVTTAATNVLNQQLGTQFVGQVFVGMTEIGKGIGEAADGAAQLASGSTQLASGAGELATGTAELASGTQQLAEGTAGLASGASGLATGASGLAAGARALASGDGADNPGLAGLASGVGQYTSNVNNALTGLQQGAGAAIAPLTQLRDAIEAGVIPVPDIPTTLAELDYLIAQLQGAASTDPSSGIEQLKGFGTSLATGTQQAAAGADQLASGMEQLAGGASQLATGANELANGTPTLAAGASQLAAGTAELATGTAGIAEGTVGLAEGLRTAADEIPSYTDAQAEKLAATMVQPVEATGASDELFNASGVPLFAGIALWAGAFASFLVLAPLWRRTREAARGVGYVTLRSALPALGIGAAQGALAGLILPVLLGYDLAQGAGFFGLAVVAGVAFSLVNQGLSAIFGGFGRFLSFALLVVAFAIGVIATAPPLLQGIGDASPIGALFGGFQAVAMGTDGFGPAMFTLVVWGFGGLALTAFAVARERRKIEV